MKSLWHTVVRVNAGREEINVEAIAAFVERCIMNTDPLAIPPIFDRRKKKE